MAKMAVLPQRVKISRKR